MYIGSYIHVYTIHLACTSKTFILLQVANIYDIPPEMIKNVFKKTKKGCLQRTHTHTHTHTQIYMYMYHAHWL